MAAKYHGELLRNIPAYAGKTSEKRIILTGCWEHPRVCGENLPFATGAKPFPGTSPRMRGKLMSCRMGL